MNQGTQATPDAPLVVTDYRGGARAQRLGAGDRGGSGRVRIQPERSLVNTATLNGQSVSSSVTVMQLYSRASSGSSITSQYVLLTQLDRADGGDVVLHGLAIAAHQRRPLVGQRARIRWCHAGAGANGVVPAFVLRTFRIRHST